MVNHSAIVENFLSNPNRVRDLILEEPMIDYTASDSVTYPGIVELPSSVIEELDSKFHMMYGSKFFPKLMFARHSYEKMNPPHWAHSDLEMADYLGLIYLSPTDYPWDGTHCVRHKKTRLETHPKTKEQVDIVMRDSNRQDLWDITYTCPSKYNRLFVLNANYLHAAAYRYGESRQDSRLVLSVFFDLI